MKKKKRLLKWLYAAGIRALKTVAQTALAILGTSMFLSEVDWVALVSATVMSGLLSLLTSVGGLPELNMNKEEENETD